jgi:hypothetical protein
MFACHRLRSVGAVGLASAGVLVGHTITYTLAPTRLSEVAGGWQRSAHGYLGAVDDLAAAFAAIALAIIMLGRVTSSQGQIGLRLLAGRLIALQVASFMAMELIERVASQVGVAQFLLSVLFPVGVFVQAGVGLAIALIVRWLLQLAAAIADGSRRSTLAVEPRFFSRLALEPPLRANTEWAAAAIRGPPLSGRT